MDVPLSIALLSIGKQPDSSNRIVGNQLVLRKKFVILVLNLERKMLALAGLRDFDSLRKLALECTARIMLLSQ